MAVNLETCKIEDAKLSSVVMESLSTSLRSVVSKEEHWKELGTIFEEYKLNKYTCEVLLVVLALIEGLNENIQAKSGQLADYEECAVQCFQVYTDVIRIWSSQKSISDTAITEENRPIRGNFLAQLVQSALHFAQHRYRHLSETALGCLFAAISGISDAEEWRGYYPGCSSGLLSLCMMGDAQSAASVRFAALVCLLRLTVRVTADQDRFNRALLHRIELGRKEEEGTSEAGDSGKDQFLKVMAQLTRRTCPEDEEEEKEGGIWPSNVADVENFVQWRVDVLQRMRQFLPVAVVTVSRGASARQSSRLQQWLALLLLSSRRYLGDMLFSDLSTVLLGGLEHENPGVRVLTWGLWGAVRQGEVASGNWAMLSANLRERCTHALHALAVTIDGETRVPNEATLVTQTRAVLGIGAVLAEDFRLLVRAPGQGLARGLAALLSPDHLKCHAAILSAQTYVCEGRSVVGAYFRAPWQCAAGDSAREGLRRMCVLLGRNGACPDLLAVVGDLQQTVRDQDMLRDQTDPRETPGRQSGSEHGDIQALQYLAGAWMALSYSLLGLTALPEEREEEKEQERDQAPCALCGVHAPVRRCTRCRDVSYCSRDHQQAHWKQHKAECRPPSLHAPVASLFGDKERAPLLKEVGLPDAVPEEGDRAARAAGDIPDPPVLLSCPRLARRMKEANRAPLAPARRGLEAVCRAVVASIKYHLPVLSKEPGGVKAQLRALVLASVIETLGHCALLLGAAFKPLLIKSLYSLLELRIAHNSVVSQAAGSTLERLGLYLGYVAPLGPSLLRANLDYFVEEACARLRPAPLGAGSRADLGQSAGVHRVVEFVLSTLMANDGDAALSGSAGSGAVADIDQSTIESAMRGLLLDCVISMDTLAGAGALTPAESVPLISMMRVLVNHAGDEACSGVQEGQVAVVGGKRYLASCLQSLRSFRRNLDVLLERDVKVDEAEAIRLEEEEGDASTLEGREREILLNVQRQMRGLERARRHEEAQQALQQELEQEKDSVQGGISLTNSANNRLHLVAEVLQRCCYYLSLPHLADQVLVISAMTDAVQKLATDRAALLPAVHKMWPSLISKLRELRAALCQQSDEMSRMEESTRLMLTLDPEARTSASRRQLLALPALLSLLSLLASLTRDFLSVKFEDDLWPELFVILTKMAPPSVLSAALPPRSPVNREALEVVSSPGPGGSIELLRAFKEENDKGHQQGVQAVKSMAVEDKHSLEAKLKVELLRCIHRVASQRDCQPFVTKVVGSCTWHTLPLLSSSQCEDVVQAATILLRAVLELDAPLVSALLQAASQPHEVAVWWALAADPRIEGVRGVDRRHRALSADPVFVRAATGILCDEMQESGVEGACVPIAFVGDLRRHERL